MSAFTLRTSVLYSSVMFPPCTAIMGWRLFSHAARHNTPKAANHRPGHRGAKGQEAGEVQLEPPRPPNTFALAPHSLPCSRENARLPIANEPCRDQLAL